MKPLSVSGRDVIQRVYDGMADGNFLDLLGELDDHIEWHEPIGYGPPLGGIHRGPVAVVRDVLGQLAARWPGLRTVPGEFLEAGDHVIVLGHALLAEAGGDEAGAGFAHVWRLRDDRVVEVRVFTDTAVAMAHASAGALP